MLSFCIFQKQNFMTYFNVVIISFTIRFVSAELGQKGYSQRDNILNYGNPLGLVLLNDFRSDANYLHRQGYPFYRSILYHAHHSGNGLNNYEPYMNNGFANNSRFPAYGLHKGLIYKGHDSYAAFDMDIGRGNLGLNSQRVKVD